MAEEVFDEMAPGIDGEVALDEAFAVLLWRDDGGGASSVQLGAYPIDVESFVPEQGVEGDILDQGLYADAVMTLARQKDEARQIANEDLAGSKARSACS